MFHNRYIRRYRHCEIIFSITEIYADIMETNFLLQLIGMHILQDFQFWIYIIKILFIFNQFNINILFKMLISNQILKDYTKLYFKLNSIFLHKKISLCQLYRKEYTLMSSEMCSDFFTFLLAG